MRRKEYTEKRRGRGSEARAVNRIDALIDTNPETFVAQSLNPEQKIRLATMLLAEHFDELVPIIQGFDTNPTERIKTTADAQKRIREQQGQFETRAQAQRQAVAVRSAVESLIPETVEQEVAEQFWADASQDLQRAIARGDKVDPSTVPSLLANRLKLYGITPAGATTPASAPRITAKLTNGTNGVTPAVAQPANDAAKALATATATQKRIRLTQRNRANAAAVPPAGAGAAPVRLPPVPQGASIEEASRRDEESPRLDQLTLIQQLSMIPHRTTGSIVLRKIAGKLEACRQGMSFAGGSCCPLLADRRPSARFSASSSRSCSSSRPSRLGVAHPGSLAPLGLLGVMGTTTGTGTGSDFTGLNEALKQTYTGPFANNIEGEMEVTQVFQDAGDFETTEGPDGKQVNIGHYISAGGGVSAMLEDDYLPDNIPPVWKQGNITIKQIAALVQLSGRTLRRVKEGPAAFATWAEMALPEKAKRVAFHKDRHAVRHGHGYRRPHQRHAGRHGRRLRRCVRYRGPRHGAEPVPPRRLVPVLGERGRLVAAHGSRGRRRDQLRRDTFDTTVSGSTATATSPRTTTTCSSAARTSTARARVSSTASRRRSTTART
jgi:hypothetical protein